MAKKATEEKLGDLHGLLADLMMEKIQSGEVNAADMAQIRQFLKDNNIEADRENKKMQGLAQASVLPFPVITDEEKEEMIL